MQTVLAAAVVATALFFTARRIWRSMHGQASGTGGGGCSNCESGSHHASDWAR